MSQSSLDLLATRLAAHLDCTQDVACQQILQIMAETGRPLAPPYLASRLQMSQETLAAHLARVPDTEFDAQGNIVGWGITLFPTQHQFRVEELTPTTSVLSLILPAARCDCVRGTFCQQSLFFLSEEAASPWMALHPEAVLLPIEEAAALGSITASMWPRSSRT